MYLSYGQITLLSYLYISLKISIILLHINDLFFITIIIYL